MLIIVYWGGLWVFVSDHIDMRLISSCVCLFTDHFCGIRFLFIFLTKLRRSWCRSCKYLLWSGIFCILKVVFSYLFIYLVLGYYYALLLLLLFFGCLCVIKSRTLIRGTIFFHQALLFNLSIAPFWLLDFLTSGRKINDE